LAKEKAYEEKCEEGLSGLITAAGAFLKRKK